jgi:hypothetical protein
VDFVKSKKFYVFLGMSVACDAGCVIQMCEADEKMTLDSVRISCSSARNSGKRIGTNPPRVPWTQPVSPWAVLSTPDDRDGAPHESAGCDFDDVTKPSSFCSIPEPGVCMLPVPQPGLEPCECVVEDGFV